MCAKKDIPSGRLRSHVALGGIELMDNDVSDELVAVFTPCVQVQRTFQGSCHSERLLTSRQHVLDDFPEARLF